MASIRQLDPIVASRIAAGEVVERPASVLRELVDNSIDAKAGTISVYVEEGGIRSMTVSDDGKGMEKEDIPASFKSHATSKISTLEDLFNLKTMGFRGEALASICACSRLTVASNGYSMTVDNGREFPVIPSGTDHGTTVTMENLFSEIPARLMFLKRASAEEKECRKTFIEKALGFPSVRFRYFVDNKLEIDLPATDMFGRSVAVMAMDKDFIGTEAVEMGTDAENIKLYAVASKPSVYRRDRTRIRVFVNGRITDCYQLVQAIANAYSVALPGGAFPWFDLYIEDNPALVDFNVHPAKRECKIRNMSDIYGLLTSMIRKALLETAREKEHKEEVAEPVLAFTPSPSRMQPQHKTETPAPKAVQPARTAPAFDPAWLDKARKVMDKSPKPVQKEDCKESPYRYIGQVFNTFLLVETGDDLLFIDQHAAHERLLYDEVTSLRDVQRLIVPYRFETEMSADDFLVRNSFIYQDLGVELVRVQPMLWEITSVPAVCRKNEEYIASYIQNRTGDVEDAKKGLFAVIACRAAIKAGDIVDASSASALLEKVFKLDAMVCPHGRSFTYRLSKAKLYKEVGRTL